MSLLSLMTRFAFFILLVVFSASGAQASDAEEVPSCTLQMKIEGAIGPGQLEYLERGLAKASEMKCRSVLLLINTPGGALATTRKMVERILASDIPVLCLVSPSGGHAGSAGAILLMACHVSGALPGTNIGAATPVLATGDELSKDARTKAIEDTVSWLKSLARLQGRSLEFAEKIVTEAKSYDATEAAALGAIDTVAPDVNAFLDFAEGRTVQMTGGRTLPVATGGLVEFEPNTRIRFFKFITDPQFAYLLFMGSLALLYFEFTHPGAIVPGVAGGIGLIVSLMAFHALDVWWGAVALIVLGIGFLVAEAFVPTFGALGIGGIISLTAGSLLLFEEGGLPAALVYGVSILTGAMMLGLAYFAYRTRRRNRLTVDKSLVGQIGEVASLEAPSRRRGMVIVGGEYWRFACERDVVVGDKVEVIEQDGLTMRVKPVETGG